MNLNKESPTESFYKHFNSNTSFKDIFKLDNENIKETSNILKHSKNDWDIHMLKIAKLCSQMSKDPSTRVGSVIMGPNKRIISTRFRDSYATDSRREGT